MSSQLSVSKRVSRDQTNRKNSQFRLNIGSQKVFAHVPIFLINQSRSWFKIFNFLNSFNWLGSVPEPGIFWLFLFISSHFSAKLQWLKIVKLRKAYSSGSFKGTSYQGVDDKKDEIAWKDLPSASDGGTRGDRSEKLFPASRTEKYNAWAGPAPAAIAFTPRIGLESEVS